MREVQQQRANPDEPLRRIEVAVVPLRGHLHSIVLEVRKMPSDILGGALLQKRKDPFFGLQKIEMTN